MAVTEEQIRLILDMGTSGKSVDEVVRGLAELERAARQAGPALEDLGKKADAAGGDRARQAGIMGLSYAFQDFTSVISMGGGLQRALFSVSNNIDQIARGFGATAEQAASLTGSFTIFTALVLPALTQGFKSLWEAIGGQAAMGKDPYERVVDVQEKMRKSVNDLRENLANMNALHDERLKKLTDEEAMLKREVTLEEERARAAKKRFEEETARQKEAEARQLDKTLQEKGVEPSERARAVDIRRIMGGPENRALRAALNRMLVTTDPFEARRAALEAQLSGAQAPGIEGQRLRAQLRNELMRLPEEQARWRQTPEGQAFAARRRGQIQRRAQLEGEFFAGQAGALERVVALEPAGVPWRDLALLTPGAELRQQVKDVRQTAIGLGRAASNKAEKEVREKREQTRKQLNEDARQGEIMSDEERDHNAREERHERERDQHLADEVLKQRLAWEERRAGKDALDAERSREITQMRNRQQAAQREIQEMTGMEVPEEHAPRALAEFRGEQARIRAETAVAMQQAMMTGGPEAAAKEEKRGRPWKMGEAMMMGGQAAAAEEAAKGQERMNEALQRFIGNLMRLRQAQDDATNMLNWAGGQFGNAGPGMRFQGVQ